MMRRRLLRRGLALPLAMSAPLGVLASIACAPGAWARHAVPLRVQPSASGAPPHTGNSPALPGQTMAPSHTVGARRAVPGSTTTPSPAATAPGQTGAPTILPPAQSRLFRAWMVRIISAQFQSGPTPRWQQRDCVGLVRFAVAEALREHDAKWKQANSMAGQTLPPEMQLDASQQALRHNWRRVDGSKSAYISALELVQENTRFLGKDCNAAQPGDLLFFDQGDAQHLMVWMGRFIAYHTGTVEKQDNGLRTLELRQLLRWPDTRWHPAPDNPNFAGVYKLQFLSA